MKPPEVPPVGPTLFLAMPPAVWTSGGFLSGPRAEGREQRKERREKRENGRQLDSLKTSTARRREKKEERREKSEERREKRRDSPQEAVKGPQMRPPERG